MLHKLQVVYCYSFQSPFLKTYQYQPESYVKTKKIQLCYVIEALVKLLLGLIYTTCFTSNCIIDLRPYKVTMTSEHFSCKIPKVVESYQFQMKFPVSHNYVCVYESKFFVKYSNYVPKATVTRAFQSYFVIFKYPLYINPIIPSVKKMTKHTLKILQYIVLNVSDLEVHLHTW